MSILNLKYSIDVDYRITSENCDCDGYCRCSTIEDIKVNPISENDKGYILSSVLDFYFDKNNQTKTVSKYVNSLLIKLGYHDNENYEVEVCGGYYGEEIDGVYHIKEEVLDKAIKEYKIKKNKS